MHRVQWRETTGEDERMAYDFRRYTDYMAKNGIDVVIASNYDITARMLGDYFTDLKLITHGCKEYNRLVGCDSAGEMIVVNCPKVPNAKGAQIARPLFEPHVRELARILNERGLGGGVIGLEMLDFPAKGLMMLQEALPQATFVDATWVIRQDMAVKTPRELHLIERAVDICEAGFRKVMAHMRESIGRPVSELIFRHFAPEVNRLGGEVVGCNLISRPWEWHNEKNDFVPPEMYRKEPLVTEGGAPINFDLLCGYHGLMCDIAFRGMPGQPDPEWAKLWDVSVIAKDALVDAVKAGMTCGEAQETCVAAMEKAVGNAYDGQYWAVHGVGLHVHEFPQVGSPYNGDSAEYVFEAGCVLSVESIAEEAYLLTENGMRRIGTMPMKIYQA